MGDLLLGLLYAVAWAPIRFAFERARKRSFARASVNLGITALVLTGALVPLWLLIIVSR
jgi:hypothetical protein